MAMKQEQHQIKGMQRDLTVSKFSPEYAYENMNIRITARENNTLMSVTNEKGTKEVNLSIDREPLEVHYGKPQSSYEAWTDKTVESDVTGYILVRDLEEIVHKYEFTISKGKSSTRIITAHLGETLEGLFFNTKEPVYDDVYQYYSDTQPAQTIYLDELLGTPLGECVINKYVTIFAKDTTTGIDYIYRISRENDNEDFKCKILFQGDANFDIEYPIQTLGSYENENIQKVYWVDGKNQARVINIIANKDYKNSYLFDFIRPLKHEEDVTITKKFQTSSNFSSGVLQYALSYFNNNGQESNIAYISRLLYVTNKDRGGAPDELCSCYFTIRILNADSNFDGANIYSIHRTSLDAVPYVKRIASIPIVDKLDFIATSSKSLEENTLDLDYRRHNLQDKFKVYTSNGEFHELSEYAFTFDQGGHKVYSFSSFHHIVDYAIYKNTIYMYNSNSFTVTIDEEEERILIKSEKENLIETVGVISTSKIITFSDPGNVGETIDPTELLYKGGEEIIPYTITQKDNTLFLGNLTIKRSYIPEDIRKELDECIVNTYLSEFTKVVDDPSQNSYYPYIGYYNDSSNRGITLFKNNETYRLGVVLLHTSGKWSEAIPIGDYLMDKPIESKYVNEILRYRFPYFHLLLEDTLLKKLANLGYVAVRPVVVYPNFEERNVIAQGILCPTVYDDTDRDSVYASSSWYARPKYVTTQDYKYDFLEFRDSGVTTGGRYLSGMEIFGYALRISESDFTFHSPDIEFNDSFPSAIKGAKMRIVGYAPIASSLSDYSIKATDRFRTNTLGGYPYKTVEHDFSRQYGTSYNQTSVSKWLSKQLRLVAAPVWTDGVITTSDPNNNDIVKDSRYSANFIVYPWHRNTSLNNDFRGNDGTSLLERKVFSTSLYLDSIYFSNDYIYDFEVAGDSYRTGITDLLLFNSNEVTPLILPKPLHVLEHNEDIYYGNIDTVKNARWSGVYVESPSQTSPMSWVQGLDIYISGSYQYPSLNSVVYTSAEPNANPDRKVYPKVNGYDSVSLRYKSTKHLVGRFNYAYNGKRVGLPQVSPFEMAIPLWNPNENDSAGDYILGTLKGMSLPADTSNLVENDYYFTNQYVDPNGYTGGDLYKVVNGKLTLLHDWGYFKVPLNLKLEYKRLDSDGYAYYVIHHRSNSNRLSIIEYDQVFRRTIHKDSLIPAIPQNYTKELAYGLFLIAEIYRDGVLNKFGGDTEFAYENNIWIAAGDTIKFEDSVSDKLAVQYYRGDTYLQRYDHLKTYPFDGNSKNNLVEIVSFMCETRINIDGRYDRNRGHKNNLSITPQNFNLFNPVYSQKDNFFTYNYLSLLKAKVDYFPNAITWTSEKMEASSIDAWTSINMASIINMDGDKGKVTSLQTLNNEIYCFQEQGISNIIFNPRVQIPVSDGVPVEIGNSYKVQGKRYISNIIGCSNKWSLCQTPNGIYFIDNLTNGMYMFDGQSISSLSDKLGFRQFIGANNSTELWNPRDFGNFRTFYDKTNDDIYFINDKYCLTYSELIGQFTSFMSYEQTPIMFNYMDKFYAINQYTDKSRVINKNKLWEINGGDYNMFYGEFKPYYVTIVANQDEPIDKIFNTIEYRADVKRDGVLMPNETFTQLDVWNEYQHGTLELVNKIGHPSSLKRKFRVWRANIPRDNGNRNRIRNTWAYVKLQMNKESTDSMELHDINVGFYE